MSGRTLHRDGNVVRVDDGRFWTMATATNHEELDRAVERAEILLRECYASNKLLYRLPSVAALLDTPLATVRGWVHTGKLPTIKVGRSVYVERDALLDFIRVHRKAR